MKDETYGCDREYFLYLVKKYSKDIDKINAALEEFAMFRVYPSDYDRDYFKNLNLDYILVTEEKYPEYLLDIPTPPPVIFYKGNLKLLNNFEKYVYLGVVGSRNPTVYGVQMCEKIISELPKNALIISGLAKGIDAKAHENALKNNLPTIAVLGTPIDEVYPKENQGLYEKILENKGLIISEVMPGSETEKENFLQRNRLIAGLCDGILLVESYGRSGALSTCNLAIEYGKDVGCVPCLALKNSNCNNLIKDGAYLVETADDLDFLF